ncbi:MAG: MFS transporter [Ignavibacteriales bacterium]|nr:MAG: MFS transporter [Ignavibacteriales bacterium]
MYNKNLVFAAACLGMLLFGIAFLSLGTIMSYLTEQYRISGETLGLLSAILPAGILIGSLIFGPLVDKYGYKALLIISSVLLVAAFELIAYTNSFGLVLFAYFLIGLGGGSLNGGTNALVSVITAEGKGSNLSFLGVFFGLGAMGMPGLLGLLSKAMSVSNIIASVGFFILLPTIYFLVIKFPNPIQQKGTKFSENLKLIKSPAVLILLGFVLFFESGLEGITNNWSAAFLEKGKGINVESSLYALTILNLGLLITRLALGFMLKKIRPFVVQFACLALILVGAILLLTSNSVTIAYIGVALLGIGFAPGFPVVLGYVGELYAEVTGTAFSIAITIALVGNTLLNYLVGSLSIPFGIGIFPTIQIISVLLMSLVFWIALGRLKSKIKV